MPNLAELDTYLEHLCEELGYMDRRASLKGYCKGPCFRSPARASSRSRRISSRSMCARGINPSIILWRNRPGRIAPYRHQCVIRSSRCWSPIPDIIGSSTTLDFQRKASIRWAGRVSIAANLASRTTARRASACRSRPSWAVCRSLINFTFPKIGQAIRTARCGWRAGRDRVCHQARNRA